MAQLTYSTVLYQLHEEPYDFWRPILQTIDYYARWGAASLLCISKRTEIRGAYPVPFWV